MIRTFVAATIRENPRLRRLRERLASLGGNLRPVAAEGMHLTLKFLGDVEEAQVAAIAEAVAKAVEGRPAFRVGLLGLGAFPHARRPSVIWVGFSDSQVLSAIAADIERELSSLGFAPEGRLFHPHLTILRLRSRPPEALLEMLKEQAGADFGSASIESVELFRSNLHKEGSRYTVLARAALKGPP